MAACGGASSSSPVAPPVAAVPTPAPTPTPATPPPSVMVPAPTYREEKAGLAATYSILPDVNGCTAGTLATEAVTSLLTSLNAIRALHQLPPVLHSAPDQPVAEAAALLTAANRDVSHEPPTTWQCYTELAATGAAQSNLFIGLFESDSSFPSDDFFLGALIIDTNNLVADSVSHRRRLLDPFLGSIAYGRVTTSTYSGRIDSAALKVLGNALSGVLGELPPFVAYPYGDYPAWLVDPSGLFSFSVIADKDARDGNSGVNFSAADIVVRERSSGLQMTISRISDDNDAFGLPNNLQFAVAGIQSNTFYDVTISGVSVRGISSTYSYSFRILPS